ncbi:protein of unknown function [Tepidibacter aestuarii]|nr:protein of unknown function [Tepidibacter aestuarii]
MYSLIISKFTLSRITHYFIQLNKLFLKINLMKKIGYLIII